MFNPSSIAVIGASNKKHKVGHQILKNLLKFKKVFPVNPNAKKILGKKSYRSITQIKEKIHTAVIAVKADIVPSILQQCAHKKVKYAIIISSGFKEAGKKGKKLQEQIIKIAKNHNIRILGPNCFGIINTANNLNTTFALKKPKKGPISFITQSGALCSALLDFNLGFSKIISLGNKADINETDILKILNKDKQTKVIMMYIETIHKDFPKIKINKPLIILKGGTSKKTKKHILSHTASIITPAIEYKTLFEKKNIIQAKTIQELINFSKVFLLLNKFKTNNIKIITNAGGPGILAVDACHKYKLKPILTDLLGDASPEDYEKAIINSNTNNLLIILTPQATTQINKIAKLIIKYKNKPILTSFIGKQQVNKAIKILEKHNIPNFKDPSEAIKSIAMLQKYKKQTPKKHYKLKINITKAKKFFKNKEIKELLKLYKIPYVKSQLIKNKKQLLNSKIQFPLVLKPVIQLHKTQLDLVKLQIKNKTQLIKAFSQLKSTLKKNNIKCNKFEIQKQIKGREIIISTKKTKFGPLIMFGLGGVYVEILKDVSFGLAPLTTQEATKMIKKIKAYKILKNTNITKIKQILLKVSKLSTDLPIKTLDLNPIIVNKKQAYVVDYKFQNEKK